MDGVGGTTRVGRCVRRLGSAVGVSLALIEPVDAATVSGRLSFPAPDSPRDGCRVEVVLSPQRNGGPGRGPGMESERRRPTVSAMAAPDGTFRLARVPEGVHTLRAECPAARAVALITIGAANEAILPAPIVLGDVTLALAVAPPLDPFGRPWRLVVATADAEPARLAALDALPRAGAWTLPGVPRGAYVAELRDHRGALWMSQPVTAGPDTGTITLAVPLTAIAGRVAFGRQPVAAQLVFTDAAASRRVALESGKDGRFSGSLPALPQGDWTVEIRAGKPALERRLEDVLAHGRADGGRTWLDLDLDTRGATGCVTNEAGAPAPGAVVTGEAAGGTRVQAVANTDGCFDLGTPAPGLYRIAAESPEGFSEGADVEIADGWPQSLTLVLKARQRLLGRVVSDHGPVSGAVVQPWLPPGVPRSAVETDGDGRFGQTLPTDASDVGVTVIAPGYATKMTRVSLADAPLDVPVGSAAGALVVEVPAATSDGARVVVRHDGTLELLEYLAQWGTTEAGRRGTRVTLPRVEPGPYTVCRVGAAEMAALWAGDAPPDRCVSGTLNEDGRLALILEPARAEAP